MLPILRIISVGGVSIAIAILALALMPPGGSHSVIARHDIEARGPLADASHHPEWRQFLLQAALRRAYELEKLRLLPSLPSRSPDAAPPVIEPDKTATDSEPQPGVAGLAVPKHDAAIEDITGSIDENPGATMPIEIGETSSTELPVMPVEERPPVSRLPALQEPEVIKPQSAIIPSAVTASIETTGKAKAVEVKPAEPTRRVVKQRLRRKPAPTPAPAPNPAAQVPPPFNILVAIFGGLANAQASKTPSMPTTQQASGTMGQAQ